MTGALAWLTHLAGSPPVPFAAGSIEEYWSAHRAALGRWETPIDGAIAGGFAADRLGFAFAAGYHAALCALVPSLEPGILTGLSATEAGGAHPRAIRSTLAPASQGGLLLSGEKRWSTLASLASGLLVVASAGTRDTGQNLLRMVRVRTDAPGVAITQLPTTPFAPEIPHCVVTLDAVAVADTEVLPGDGYADYLKPFRTLEDLHVHAALLAYLVAVARRAGFPRDVVERALALLAAAHTLASGPPAAPELHVALGGLLEATARLLEASSAHWARAEPAERERWDRDQPLLSVASGARQARLARAWATLPGEELAQTAEGD
jgi:alkylation response protein AidB-like acyl-CoA dehydrogenase